jgi:hypothetical protein
LALGLRQKPPHFALVVVLLEQSRRRELVLPQEKLSLLAHCLRLAVSPLLPQKVR